MFIQINPQNGVAVYDQICRQVKFAVADGVLAPGDLIPSVRELARELAINPNTVARAYRELQHEGIIQTVLGTGLEVRTGARRTCQTQRRGLLQARIAQALEEAFQAGLNHDEVSALVSGELERLARLSRRTGDEK